MPPRPGKKPGLAFVCALVGLLGGVPSPPAARADDGATAVNLALFAPVQTASSDRSVTALRLSLLYGQNAALQGVDLGTVTHTTGRVIGLQWNLLIGLVDGDFDGWQHGLVAVTRGKLTGLQTGGLNLIHAGEGVQIGTVNVASDFSGLQLGLVNVTDRLHGLQIGLVNVIRDKHGLPVLPLVNWQF